MRHEPAEALIAALRDGTGAAFDALRSTLAPDVTFVSAVTGPCSGPDAVVPQLQAFQRAGRSARAERWHAGGAKANAELPLDSYYAAYTWELECDAEGLVTKITPAGMQQTQPLPPSQVRIGPELVEALRIARET